MSLTANSIPAWKSFLQVSLKENIEKIGSSATYASIATVRQDNTPAVRTVVMRGFVGEHHSEQVGWQSDLLVIITDKRSDKIKEIQNNPNTEINWYMNGTMEQFRIRGKVNIIDKNYNPQKLQHLQNHVFLKSSEATVDPSTEKSLALQMFLNQQSYHATDDTTTTNFNWQAERLRHFYQFGGKMRMEMTKSKTKELEIDAIDENTGWFKNKDQKIQELLEEAFDNFVLLVIKVTSVRHWSPTTGTKSML